jgi:hypothetical protein
MKKLALLLAVVAAAGAAGCGRDSSPRPDVVVAHKDAAKILQETPWLDRAPEREQDVVKAWVFPRGEGVYFEGNAFKGSYELFSYFIEEDELRIRFLDDGKSHKVKYTIEKVDHRIFDYKLTFDQSPRGPKVYYGFDHQHALPPAARAVIARIAD